MIINRAPDLEAMATALQASGQYRVLRKLPPRATFAPAEGAPTRLGLFIDVETTGLDTARDEVIELAMVPFTYGLDGRIFEILPPYESFAEPRKPVPPEITRITGITDAMVEGQSLDMPAIEAMVSGSALIVAHNAGFDRRFAERISAAFESKPWACSMSQFDWAGEGRDGVKLGHLVASAGYFYDGHRAANDCHAAIALLAAPLASGLPAMAQLLENARRPSWRIWAEGSPFELKDTLKARGYRWNAEGPSPKAWYVDVDQDRREAELSFLRDEIYQREIDLLAHAITAHNRFSDRVASRASTAAGLDVA